MSSLFGSNTTTHQTSTSEPFSGQYKQYADQVGSNLMSKLGTKAQAYTGQLTANPSTDLTGSIANLNSYANNANLNKFANGDYLDPTSNPYAMSGYNSAVDGMMKQFGQLDDRIKGSFNGSGFFNSSMRGNSQNQNAISTKDSIGKFGSDYWNTQYNNGIKNFMDANTMRQQTANDALKANTVGQQLSQDGLDRQYKEFQRQTGVDDQTMQTILQYLNTVKNPTTNTTGTQHTSGLFG